MKISKHQAPKTVKSVKSPPEYPLLAPFDGFDGFVGGRNENFQFSPDRVEKGFPKCPTARSAEIKRELHAPVMGLRNQDLVQRCNSGAAERVAEPVERKKASGAMSEAMRQSIAELRKSLEGVEKVETRWQGRTAGRLR